MTTIECKYCGAKNQRMGQQLNVFHSFLVAEVEISDRAAIVKFDAVPY